MDAAVTDGYDAHGIAFFRLNCTLNAQDKKDFIPPKKWQLLSPTDPTMRRAGNAVGIRCGPPARPEGRHIVVVDADGADAIDIVMRMLERTCEAGFHARVPQVQSQRGPGGRHFYFSAEPGSLASTLGSRAGLDIAGVKTGVDIRAGYRGKETNESVGFVFAPPTILKPGAKPRAYTLLPGPAIHEAPFMPEALARAIAAGGCPCAGAEAAAAQAQVPFRRAAERSAEGSETEATDDATEGGEGAEAPATAAALTPEQEAAFKREALRVVVARAKTARVGYPDSVELIADAEPVFGCPAVCIKFRFKRGTSRVCPVTHVEHARNNFNVTLGVDMKGPSATGLPAFFVFCHSEKCVSVEKKQKKPKMLGLVDTASYAELGIVCSGVSRRSAPARSLGQTIVLLGEMQKSIDRLIENPGASGTWGTVTALGEIACALFTAASAFPSPLSCAKDMLDQLVAASTLTDAEKEQAARGFQHAKRTLDPLMKLRGYAEGLLGTREQELMAVREAITAHTDPALEANVPLAADALLTVLDYCERRDSNNRVHSLGNIAHMALFLYYIWRRIARYGFDSSQQSDSTQWTFYLFNGATYERGQWDQFAIEAEEHLRLVVEELLSRPQLSSRTMTLDARCNSSDFVAKGLAKMQMLIKHVKRLAKCGLISPTEFERTLDTGNFIGLTNGVFDVTGDRFMPTGSVPLNVLVSVTTRFSYVGEDDPAFPENRAQLVELYRTLHADDYTNPNDERLRAMWIFAGSLLTRGNVNKKAFIFLGSEGDNGKSTYTELLQATLGDYAVTGNKRALSGNEQDSLDPDLVSNHKALMCVFPEMQSMEGGVSTGFRFNYAKLKSLTGADPLAVRDLFKKKKDIVFYAKLVAHTNIAPHVDGDDSASCNRLWMARFGSTFPEGLTEADVHRRRFPRIDDIKDRIVQWAPYHFLMCLEALREFRKLKFVLPPGAQHIEGSLMHQSAAAQTPEGKLRGWVEQNYTHISDKDNGTKLKDLYEAYSTAVPSVHQRPLQKRRFGEMMCSLFPGIGPHTNRAGTIQGLFLLARYGE